MSAFGASELKRLEQIFEEVLAEARGRRLGFTHEVAARRIFDAARAGTKDKAGLKAAAFGADIDDEPFPPDLGMRPLPIPKSKWPVPGLAV